MKDAAASLLGQVSVIENVCEPDQPVLNPPEPIGALIKPISPARPAIWDAIIAEKEAEGDEFMLMVFETFKQSLSLDAFTPPLIPEWIEFTNVLYPELQAAILGDKTPEQALETASKKATEIMEDAGYF